MNDFNLSCCGRGFDSLRLHQFKEKGMKVGDKIKIFSVRDDSYEVGTVVEILEKSIKYKREGIGGHFITLKSRCALLFCEACGCDPCDCHWGNY